MRANNRVSRICSKLGVGISNVSAGRSRNIIMTESPTAVERVLAIRAAKIAALRREEERKEEMKLTQPQPKLLIKPSGRKIDRDARKTEAETMAHNKKVVLCGQSNLSSCEPMRPRISLKGLDVYVRSRLGGREEPVRRFARLKKTRIGNRESIRHVMPIDIELDDGDDMM